MNKVQNYYRLTNKRNLRDNRLIISLEFLSMEVFGTSMSAYHLLGLEKILRVWLFAN